MNPIDFEAAARPLRARARPGLAPADVDRQRAHLVHRLTLLATRSAPRRIDIQPTARFADLRRLAERRAPTR